MSHWMDLPGDPTLPPGCTAADVEETTCAHCGRHVHEDRYLCRRCERDQRIAEEGDRHGELEEEAEMLAAKGGRA